MSDPDGFLAPALSLDEIGAMGRLPAILILDLDTIDERSLPSPTLAETADAGRLFPAKGQGLAARRHRLRRQILRCLAASYCSQPANSIIIGASPLGAPLVQPDGMGLRASLSHRGSIAAFALHSAPIGIDVEPDREIDPLPLGLLHPNERCRLEALPAAGRSAAFLRLWTLKEACLKALQTGVETPLDAFEIETGADPAIVRGLGTGPRLCLRHRRVALPGGSALHLGMAISGPR